MEINNARIKNVTVGLEEYGAGLSAMMTFECEFGCCKWSFRMNNSADVQRLVKLMNYTGVCDVKNLEGRIVRVATHCTALRGFGDPIEDKFVPVWSQEFKEVTEAQIEELLKNK